MLESCANCAFCFPIQEWDYSKIRTNEAWKKELNGCACTLFAHDDGYVIYKVGEDADMGLCECFTPKEGENQ